MKMEQTVFRNVGIYNSDAGESSGAQEYYTVLAACGNPASIRQTVHITLSSAPDQQLKNHSTKYHREQPLYNTLELLMLQHSGARNMLSKQ